MAFRSKWVGAWKNDNSEFFHSQYFDKQVLNDVIRGDKFRIVIKRNKAHTAGDNRPPFVLAIADDDYNSVCNTVTSEDLQFDNLLDEFIDKLDDDGTLYVEETEAINYARRGAESVRNGHDPHDVYAIGDMQTYTAKDLFDEALEATTDDDDDG